jgi:nitroreductase
MSGEVRIPAGIVRRTSRELDDALRHAAAVAGDAPSMHNTQPWRWHVAAGALELWADRGRQLAVADPAGRMLTISCGAALHHALVTLAVQGLRAAVLPLPDPARPDLLARVTVAGNAPIATATIRMYDAIGLRRTDRRPAAAGPMDESTMAAVANAARPYGAFLRYLTRDRVDALARLAWAAARTQQADGRWRAELANWTGDPGGSGTGVPDVNLPDRPVGTPVPERDFGRRGTLPVTAVAAGTPAYAVLYGEEDGPAGWLRAGQALSALWLTAGELGVSVVPISSVTEVLETRRALRELLARTSYPYLVLRLNLTDPSGRGPLATPRLPVDRTVTSAEDEVGHRPPEGTVGHP